MTPSRRRRRTIYQDRLRADHPGDYRAFIPKEGLPFFHRAGLDDQKQLRWFSPFFGDISSIKKVISGPEGAPAVGQVWRAEANFLGQDKLLNLRVAELVPNKLVRFALDGDPQAVVQLRLAPDSTSQSTDVALSLEATGIPTIILNAVLGGLLGQDMLRLKHLLEHKR